MRSELARRLKVSSPSSGAIHLLQEREAECKIQIGVLKRLLREGEESGESVPGDPESIKKRARIRLRTQR